jgi:hypothetical protein
MKKPIFSFLLFFILPGIWVDCKAQEIKPDTTPVFLHTSLPVRQSVYSKGNLIPNASFEDPNGLSHWTVVGKEVSLTDASRNAKDSLEARSGKHAIKIVRAKTAVNEVDGQSEGVLSDFIEVIPGNYNFDFDIRLENIFPAVERFQSRLSKGIDIHLEFFDEQKRAISPGYYFEYLGKEVDNSFKGFAFSNFFYIDQFGWARVKGRSWNYPYSEGDLPANCKYVKIFAGLNGSGTMWIDNLDFHLSRWNFTPIDRVDSFFNRTYTRSQLLIPTPRRVENEHPIDLKRVKPVLVYDGKAAPEINAAFTLLRKRFFKIYKDSLKAYSSEKLVTGSSNRNLQMIFLSSETSNSPEWADAFQAIQHEDEGYFIRRKENRIYIGAYKPQGLYYAATTLCQLLDDQRAVLDYADITDFPDFTGRSSVLMGYQNNWELDQNKSLTDSMKRQSQQDRQKNLEQQVRDIDFYAFYKINQLYDNYFQDSKRWWLPGDFYKTYYQKIGERCAQYGAVIQTAVQVNPYYHINMEQRLDTLTDSLVRIFAHGTDDGFEKILNVLRPALDAGAKTVMLCADDYIPHVGLPRGEYTLFNPVDKAQFTNLANAQNFLLNKLKAWLDQHYGKIRLEFVPAQYNNYFVDYTRGTAESYFHDLTNHLNPDIVIVWTGNTIRSLSYDASDIFRFTDLIQRKPMVWDNSPYARLVESKNGGYPANYPEKSILCNLVEPFDIEYPNDFSSYLDPHYYSNLGGFGELNKIKYLTFADFAWNNKAYNPDFSLFKALVNYLGKEDGRLVLKFNEAYFDFVSLWGRVKLEKTHDPAYQCSPEESRLAKTKTGQLMVAFHALKNLNNQALVKELKGVMEAKTADWKRMTGKND